MIKELEKKFETVIASNDKREVVILLFEYKAKTTIDFYMLSIKALFINLFLNPFIRIKVENKDRIYTKQNILDMVGEDLISADGYNGFVEIGYNQAKQEIRDKLK